LTIICISKISSEF